ncbi:transcriptional regulator, AsnC family [Salinimicrobium catena]|uniref:Transcriptional regulator, AsnC family n=1 Tax=Salinimicrobium catena TaxID=390640 RepID=A0A1H5LAQ4_9FLAO|nr:Lrp/AsnC family transcriptional regulator [Salinimicrobium catena]SDL07802.1 Lrp/AsnC family transcriptional regulator, leucine-responsive regulatory protein [Salinimicrobium catena]SEE74113.1 transcriptional regulator, AsnC family [Salinimicrobium catena]
MKLDAKDKELLGLLQDNSKKTNKELSNKLGLSVTAVYERIRKLERAGVISKYVALVKPDKVERAFTAFCQIKLVQHTKGNVTQFESQVAGLSEVLEVYHVSGEYDYILKVMVKDMEAYRYFMVNKLTALDHIGSTQSTFVISPVKNTTALSTD